MRLFRIIISKGRIDASGRNEVDNPSEDGIEFFRMLIYGERIIGVLISL